MKQMLALLLALVMCIGLVATVAYAEEAPAGPTEEEIAQMEAEAEVVIYLTRHGKTLFNTVGRVQGWCDSPLTDAGIEVAENLGLGLKDVGVVFDAAYSSDLGRQRDTARIVLDQLGQADTPILENRGLRETCFGSWEGELESVRDAVYCEKAGTESVYEIYAMGGSVFSDITVETDETGLAEDQATMEARIMGALNDIAEEAKAAGQKTVLVVTSGGIINVLLPLLGAPGANLSNASVTMLYYNGGEFKVGVIGDMSYAELGATLR